MKIPCIVALLLAGGPAVRAQQPATGFAVSSAFPKYVTADVEFRDPAGVKWPNLFYGKPAATSGIISLDPANPVASFVLLCDKMTQDRGDQSRKVLGELYPPEKAPAVTLTIASMSAFQPAAQGAKNKPPATADLNGTLEIAGRKLPVKIAATLRPHNGSGDEKNGVLELEGKTSCKASDLGLKALAPAALVEIRFGLTAYPPRPAP